MLSMRWMTSAMITALALGACVDEAERVVATPAPTLPLEDVVDTAASAGSFTTLVSAIQAAGLEETLRGPGPFTVFAPTDEAFRVLPPGALESLLLPENRDQLRAVLTLHVVEGTLSGTDLAALPSVTTLNGQSVTITGMPDGTLRVGEASVVTADVPASNGVIHAISAVLLPQPDATPQPP
jgi:uncharacterized surface protein with fasciclin (FAS1) repeats